MKIVLCKTGIRSFWKNDKLITGFGKTRGGGIFLKGKNNFEIRNMIFMLNYVQMDGGGIYLCNCHNVTIENCCFVINFSKWGGGIYLEKCSNINVINNFFGLNFAKRDGGALSISNSENIVLCDNRFWGNIAFRSNHNVDLLNSRKIKIERG